MRAALALAGPPWLSIEQCPDPAPEPGDLILRVESCGICGSDLHLAHATAASPALAGTIYGHEFAGTVVALGSEVTGYREGERVVGFPLAGCRSCDACRAGFVGRCRSARLNGVQRPGAYAEYVAVGAAESFLLPAPLSSDAGALVEPLAVAHHALEITERTKDEPVLVLGGGPVGLAVALWAQALGAREVVVSDPQPHRRAIAASFGARVIDPATDDVGRAFADLTGARPRAIVECVGRPEAIQHAIDVAGREAQLTLAGACTSPASIVPMTATMKELTLRFAVYYQRADFAATIEAMAAGRLDPSPLVTSTVSLDALPASFAELMATSQECKVLIHPQATTRPGG